MGGGSVAKNSARLFLAIRGRAECVGRIGARFRAVAGAAAMVNKPRFRRYRRMRLRGGNQVLNLEVSEYMAGPHLYHSSKKSTL
jgi:hypothetical protein